MEIFSFVFLGIILTNSREQSPWGGNSCSTDQEITCHVQVLKFYYSPLMFAMKFCLFVLGKK